MNTRHLILPMTILQIACATGVDDNYSENEDGVGGSSSSAVSTAATVGSTTAGPTTATSSSSQSSSSSTANSSASSGGGSDTLPICDSGFVLPNTPEDAACASCMGNYCCQEHKDCAGDSNCMACLTQQNGAACDATLTDDAVFTCVVDLCTGVCGHLLN